MQKVACGVILYNPDIEKVIKDIIRYSSLFDEVILFDNSSKECEKIQRYIEDLPNVSYLRDGYNVGLPKAYNRIIQKLEKYDYLCALDQDSLYKSEDIHMMNKAIDYFPSDAAVVGPHIIYNNNETFCKGNYFSKRRYVITSGCFINLNYMRKEHIVFDEKYFIDKFEVDLDMQFRKKGYSIYEYENAILYQQLGTLGKNGRSNHSPIRHYYLFRNRFYFNHKYFGILKRYILNVLQTLRQILRILILEENKVNKIKQLPIAIKDYLYGRMEKYV